MPAWGEQRGADLLGEVGSKMVGSEPLVRTQMVGVDASPAVLLRPERLWLQSRIRKMVDSRWGWKLVFVGYRGAGTCACDHCRE